MINFTHALAAEWGRYGIRSQRAGAGLLPEQDDQGHLMQAAGGATKDRQTCAAAAHGDDKT